VFIVRASPVSPITARADLEMVVTLRCFWRQPLADRNLGYGLQQDIAADIAENGAAAPNKDLKQVLPRPG
jgi:hypothetical protein